MNLKKSVLLKVGAILAGFVVFIGAMILTVLWALETQKADGLVINMAGRQRMLSQKFSKEVFDEMGSTERVSAEGRLYQDTAELFETTLRALSRGGETYSDLGMTRGISLPATTDPEILAQLGRVSGLWDQLRTEVASLESGSAAGERLDEVRRLNLAVLSNMNMAVTMYEEASGAKIQRLKLIQLGFLVAAVALAALGVVLLRKSIGAPIQALLAGVEQMSSGDLETRVSIRSVDEFGRLGNSFNDMVSQIAETMARTEAAQSEVEASFREAEAQRRHVMAVAEKVLGTSQQVASSSSGLSSTASQLAVGSERQQETVEGSAASIQEMAASAKSVAGNMDEVSRLVTENSAALTQLAQSVVSVTQSGEQMNQAVLTNSSSIEELAASIQTQAQHADQANQTAQGASQAAEEGAQVVRQAIAGMERIADRVRSSAATIGELGKSSEQISTVVAVINDIADQTNLLALNAAIEAARAGEQGRGFAVVADAVRQLAERTSKATQEIDEMIGRIQRETQEVVGSMEEGVHEVEEGTELASRSGTALEQIGQGVSQVNELMGQLTGSTREQAATSDQIVTATTEMNELVQQVTNAMGEQSQAVDVVSQSSEEMQGRVEQVAGAMREQQTASEQVAQSMEEVNGLAQEALRSARAMDGSTSELAQKAEDLKELANSFEADGSGAEAADDPPGGHQLPAEPEQLGDRDGEGPLK